MNPSILFGLFAAVVAILATVAIERLGGRLGGLIASVPSTIIPASLGFWWAAQEPAHFQDALFAVPGGMMVSGVFLYAWRVLPERLRSASPGRTILKVTILSLVLWCGCAATLVFCLGLSPLPVSTVGPVLFGLLLALGISACWRPPPAPRGQRKVGLATLAARGLLAGSAIAVSVVLAEMGIPLVAGMASVFPAIFLTAMVSVSLSQGEAVQGGAVGPMILGSSSVCAYALLSIWTYPTFGPALGVLVSWTGAVLLISVPAWRYLRWRGARA